MDSGNIAYSDEKGQYILEGGVDSRKVAYLRMGIF